jgi:subfamily B ATP-binding cassette protein MsbA
MRVKLYRHLQRLSASFYEMKQSGEVSSRVINDIGRVEFMIGSFSKVAFDLAAFLPFLVFGLIVSKTLTFVSLLFCFLYGYIFITRLPQLRTQARQAQAELGKMTGEAVEKLKGIKVIQSFVREKETERNFTNYTFQYYLTSQGLIKARSFLSSLGETIPNFGRVSVLGLGTYLYLCGDISIGNLVTFLVYLPYIFSPIQRLAESSLEIAHALGSMDRVFEFFDTQPEVKDLKCAQPLKNIKGKVEFQHVYFNYPTGSSSHPVLQDISFIVEPGMTVALVGPSGAGKTTIVDLLSRFYEPQRGRILIDGVDIKKIKLSSLRQNIGTVMQENILFSGTIEENLKLGKPTATYEELREATQKASAYEFISSFKDGFKTVIGERGTRLSIGQRQRIAIARAYLKNPKILVLDEATSSVDTETERLIQEALAELRKGRTTFIIAHRLSTILTADLILVVAEGEIKERGSHRELLSQGGIYARLFSEQFAAPLVR